MNPNVFVGLFNNSALQHPPTRGLRDLVLGEEYRLLEMKKVWTRYGFVIVAIVKDKEGVVFQTYLPSKYTNRFTEMDLKLVFQYQFLLSYVKVDGEEEPKLCLRYE
jgi:hypothetical protein